MKRHVIVLLVVGAMLLWGAPAAAGQELIVSAAASLTIIAFGSELGITTLVPGFFRTIQ